jgi:hypothetical protein
MLVTSTPCTPHASGRGLRQVAYGHVYVTWLCLSHWRQRLCTTISSVLLGERNDSPLWRNCKQLKGILQRYLSLQTDHAYSDDAFYYCSLSTASDDAFCSSTRISRAI